MTTRATIRKALAVRLSLAAQQAGAAIVWRDAQSGAEIHFLPDIPKPAPVDKPRQNRTPASLSEWREKVDAETAGLAGTAQRQGKAP